MKYSFLDEKLSELKNNSAFRQARTLGVDGYHANDLINFSSNDYLGLAGDKQLQQAFFDHAFDGKDPLTISNWMSASSSRPLTGTSPSHTELESLIAASYNKSDALLFNSGYHANTGILPAIASQGDLVLADKAIHASLIDGLKLGSADFKRFSHNNVEHLEELLNKYRENYRDVWIVTESLFSMDGDFSPLSEMVALKNKYQSYLYVDEAHAVGCVGETGLGLASHLGLVNDIDLIIGTFGKALAGCGGFATGNQSLIDSMVNFSRSWLFSTALPPINTQWNLYIWHQLSEFNIQREQLNTLTTFFKQGLEKLDIDFLGDSYIVPIIKAGNSNVVALSKQLESSGLLAMPIRSPTVRKGSERIRFSLTANMPKTALSQCLDCLNDL